MKRPRGGSLFLVLTPDELLSRIATLVPPPRTHALRYHGLSQLQAPGAGEAQSVGLRLIARHVALDSGRWSGGVCERSRPDRPGLPRSFALGALDPCAYGALARQVQFRRPGRALASPDDEMRWALAVILSEGPCQTPPNMRPS
jgi:hypothetical protein